MDCPTCEAMVDAYVDGELSASESAAFEQALAVLPRVPARGWRSAREMSAAAARHCRPNRRPIFCAPASSASCASIAGRPNASACAGWRWRRA